jgi:hypothetical protein
LNSAVGPAFGHSLNKNQLSIRTKLQYQTQRQISNFLTRIIQKIIIKRQNVFGLKVRDVDMIFFSIFSQRINNANANVSELLSLAVGKFEYRLDDSWEILGKKDLWLIERAKDDLLDLAVFGIFENLE